MLRKVNRAIKNRETSTVLLLICCLLFIFVIPTIEFWTAILPVLLFSAILFLAAYSISRKVVVFGVAAILIELATKTTGLVFIHYLATLASNVFILFVVGSVIRQLLQKRDVNIYTLVEAVNGYLLLAILFISLVAFCDQYIPGSYNVPGESDMELVYYTLVTLTTAGYGDITPKLPVAQSLAMFIAVTGQFYVAVIVAILVGKYSSISGSASEE
jgi:hypothetical protein